MSANYQNYIALPERPLWHSAHTAKPNGLSGTWMTSSLSSGTRIIYEKAIICICMGALGSVMIFTCAWYLALLSSDLNSNVILQSRHILWHCYQINLMHFIEHSQRFSIWTLFPLNQSSVGLDDLCLMCDHFLNWNWWRWSSTVNHLIVMISHQRHVLFIYLFF